MSRGSKVLILILAGLLSGTLAGCGGAGGSSTGVAATGAATPSATAKDTSSMQSTVAGGTATTHHAAAPPRRPASPRPAAYPQLLAPALGSRPIPFVPAVLWQGEPAAWVARSGTVALLSFNQRLVELHLHSGTQDAGSSGWRFGPAVSDSERGTLIAAFNGGFRFSTGSGGFLSYGRIAAPLSDGVGSIVTYTDGYTDIGAWHAGMPVPGRAIASVRQNLALLIDHGVAAANVDCITCWGATLGGVSDPARSALGVTADGRLIWAAGEHLTPADLASALLAARVVRAVELDINPEWVAGYLYGHRGGHGPLAPVPVAPGQQGIPGEFLAPWIRDFFTIVAR